MPKGSRGIDGAGSAAQAAVRGRASRPARASDAATKRRFIENSATREHFDTLLVRRYRDVKRAGFTFLRAGRDGHTRCCYSLSPNKAANRFSPVRVKLTTRLPGV